MKSKFKIFAKTAVFAAFAALFFACGSDYKIEEWDPKTAGWSGPHVVWSGKEDLGTKWSENFIIPPEKFAYCEPEGTFTVKCDVGGESYHMILIKNLTWGNLSINPDSTSDPQEKIRAGAWNLTGDPELDVFQLSAASLLPVQKNGVRIQGYDATILEILYTPPAKEGADPNAIWEGTSTFGSGWKDSLSLVSSYFKNCEDECTFILEFEVSGTSGNLEFDNGGWSKISVLTSSTATVSDDVYSVNKDHSPFVFKLDSSTFDLIKAGGMIIKGTDITIKKLSFEAPKFTSGAIWTGEASGAWKGTTIAENGQIFENCTDQGIFVVDFAVEGASKIKIANPNGWETLTKTGIHIQSESEVPLPDGEGWFSITTSPLVFTLDSSNIEFIKENGLLLQHNDITMTQVSYYPSGKIPEPCTLSFEKKGLTADKVVEIDLEKLGNYVVRGLSCTVNASAAGLTPVFVLKIGDDEIELKSAASATTTAGTELFVSTVELPAKGAPFSAETCTKPTANFPKNGLAKMVGIKFTGAAEKFDVRVLDFSVTGDQAIDISGIKAK